MHQIEINPLQTRTQTDYQFEVTSDDPLRPAPCLARPVAPAPPCRPGQARCLGRHPLPVALPVLVGRRKPRGKFGLSVGTVGPAGGAALRWEITTLESFSKRLRIIQQTP